MVRDILSNKWFFTFVVGWIVFFALVDWRSLSKNFWGGIISCILELWEDALAYSMGMYFFLEKGLEILHVSAYFTFGITLTMGILFVQFLPEKPGLQLVHLLAFTVGFVVFEAIVKYAGILITPHWNLTASFVNNLLIFGGVMWFNDFFKKRAGKSG
ncbi:hypothetical protein Cst_c04760 [Thermoclostridium stercorarium subsp. stercorarium DSM 8532]|uniref:Uncharacterized protein n=2 Tax=Thermoclostridium stercorarium TaxID=1510 RepID=L7VPJ7_THES1|nr:hypothetical protein [Thermoclostridium stercorarium]AGC67498.1 hypothetical protein Cst_c04760 [Thermoclostridium stercorarium subsp. stercorarium DSM 8532]AGI38553.1 hypothetical protein Clst_0453 [Thermoclostridium stercorarium subsp. stercorarium DSM 8532]ANW97925.1 hypothetical protein CSTERTH_02170 [Thermoclostridium stercorarium subsp. thermolacticum DSM 2910]